MKGKLICDWSPEITDGSDKACQVQRKGFRSMLSNLVNEDQSRFIESIHLCVISLYSSLSFHGVSNGAPVPENSNSFTLYFSPSVRNVLGKETEI